MKQTKVDATLSALDTNILKNVLFTYERVLREEFFKIPREDIYGKKACEETIYSLLFLREFIEQKYSHSGNSKKYVIRFFTGLDKPQDLPEENCLLVPFEYTSYIAKAFANEIYEKTYTYFESNHHIEGSKEKLEKRIQKLMHFKSIFVITNFLPGLVIFEEKTWSNWGNFWADDY